MDRSEVREFVISRLKEKLILFDISGDELKDSFDLVRSGLLDSMAFVDLVAGLEEKYELEIDFEKAAASDNFTQLGGLMDIILHV